MSTEKNQVATTERGRVSYQVAGQDVNLDFNIVKSYLTKGGGHVSDQELTLFISICKYNQLNPFLNEAYLVKFGNSTASMIVSKEAFFKRAEENKNYEGIQAGIILLREGKIIEEEGAFKLKNDTLLGGWAKVYRSDRKFPVVSRVALEEYDKHQSVWNEKKSTMISKVAKVQALREAFPAQLGAMYTEEESNVRDITDFQVPDKKLDELNEVETVREGPKETAPEEEKPTPSAPQQTTIDPGF